MSTPAQHHSVPVPTPVPPVLKNLSTAHITLGCDPEFFFEQQGKIVGAEKVLPKGLTSDFNSNTKFVLDGVQIELNPNPGTCRQSLAAEIAQAFNSLRAHLQTFGEKSFKANFTTCIDLTPQELATLSDKAKILGCAPSLHREGDEEAKKALINIDAAKVTARSAGGHIHLGLDASLRAKAPRIVDLLDILVGNTCVLIDRDPAAPERRKLYGKAGEYRLPKHGLEYRTLSNFWLRHYVLMSFVMGAARFAAYLQSTEDAAPTYEKALERIPPPCYNPQQAAEYVRQQREYNESMAWRPAQTLIDLVGGEKGLSTIRKVINANDRDGALETWEKVKPLIRMLRPGNYGFSPELLRNMDAFFAGIHADGLKAFFPEEDIVAYWSTSNQATGWERWIANNAHVSKYYKLIDKK